MTRPKNVKYNALNVKFKKLSSGSSVITVKTSKGKIFSFGINNYAAYVLVLHATTVNVVSFVDSLKAKIEDSNVDASVYSLTLNGSE
jgi:hypothetical protein